MVDVIDKERQALDPKLKALLEDETKDASQSDDGDGSFVYCATCSMVIARTSDATSINGSHHHSCTNPHGIDFNVCCYSEALGCAISGHPTAADSWFMGYAWRFASCSGCAIHLGWLFEHSSDSTDHFYGLVREQIQIEQSKAD